MPTTHTLTYRFTPTCVGTMMFGDMPANLIPVHPHVRGDNYFSNLHYKFLTGSPPRAWGQCVIEIIANKYLRFTPTCVGTIGNMVTPASVVTVHPHVRGDNRNTHCTPSPHNGSPPRAWGQYITIFVNHPTARFTPTCVGTMCNRARKIIIDSVHPHVRGDNVSSASNLKLLNGSPPRAWGQ